MNNYNLLVLLEDSLGGGGVRTGDCSLRSCEVCVGDGEVKSGGGVSLSETSGLQF